MDNVDKRILYGLNWNCRQTDSEIGKKHGASKQVIGYRIRNLEKEKVIFGYSTIIDWRKLGFNSVRIYLKWRNITPAKEKEIQEYVRKNPFFMWSIRFEGDIDLAFYVWTKNIIDFDREWNKFLSKYKKYIFKQEIYESVLMVNYPFNFLIGRPNNEEKIIGSGDIEDFDKKDYEILSELSFNARMSVVDLARKVNLTPKAVMYRIKNLEKKKIILGYSAIINTEQMGYNFYKVDFYLNDLSKIEEMEAFAKSNEKIVYRMKTIGGPDYEIEAVVKNIHELKDLIEEVRSKFSEVIDYYRFHRFDYTIKQVYLPGQIIENGKVVSEPLKKIV
jgi:Lrp/AsnC family transcriptional regulator, leucine-responsive regulatory protein